MQVIWLIKIFIFPVDLMPGCPNFPLQNVPTNSRNPSGEEGRQKEVVDKYIYFSCIFVNYSNLSKSVGSESKLTVVDIYLLPHRYFVLMNIFCMLY